MVCSAAGELYFFVQLEEIMAKDGMLKGKAAVVTGAGRGIERAMALAMAERIPQAFKTSFTPLERTMDVFCWDPI